jgi:tRNA(Ile)-lysidine synthase
MGEVEEIYQQAIGQYRKKLLVAKGAEYHIPVERLRHCTPLRTIFFELVRPFGFRAGQLPDLLHLLDAETGKYVSSAHYRVIRNRKWLIIAPAAPQDVSHHVIDRLPSVVRSSHWELQLQLVDAGNKSGPVKDETITLDAASIVLPLLLRKWKQGDYFYPLGMKKKKKVARFLIDEKVPMNEKENTWVLVSDERIVCVLLRKAGVLMHRIDDRCKRSAGTAQLVLIDQKPLD